MLLRGACVHHDNGVLGAATIDRADERRVERLQAAGFNAIRSAHNPMSKAMLRACDRLGMLVMDETFDVWLQTKSEDDYALRFADWWEADVEAMVRKDINHPSVILYSIGNEVPDGSTPVGLQVGRALAEKVRALDDTRFVTQAVTGMLVGGPELFDEIRDAATASRDRRGDRRQHRGDEPGRHHGGSDALASRHGQDPGGVLASRRRRVQLHGDPLRARPRALPAAGDRGDRVASSVHRQGLGRGVAQPATSSATSPGPVGTTSVRRASGAWSTERHSPGSAWPRSRRLSRGSRRGARTSTSPGTAVRSRTTARSSGVSAPIRTSRSTLPSTTAGRSSHSSPWSWSDVISSWTWPGSEGSAVTVEVYADADEVELLLDGRVARPPAPCGPEHRFRAEFETAYSPGMLEAVAWRDDLEIGRTALRSATGAVLLDVHADRKEIAAGVEDLAFVELALVDDAGSLYTGVDRLVAVAVDGPGVLQGFGSAEPAAPKSASTRRPARHSAVAPSRSCARPVLGTITVTLSAEGCDPARVRIDALG